SVGSPAAVLVVLLVAFVLGPPPTAARRAVTLVVLVRWHGLVELEDLLRPLCDSLVKNGDHLALFFIGQLQPRVAKLFLQRCTLLVVVVDRLLQPFARVFLHAGDLGAGVL